MTTIIRFPRTTTLAAVLTLLTAGCGDADVSEADGSTGGAGSTRGAGSTVSGQGAGSTATSGQGAGSTSTSGQGAGSTSGQGAGSTSSGPDGGGGSSVVPGNPVDLGVAAGYVIIAKSGISNVPTSAITGDLAVSPAAASYITGFSLTADATNVFSTSLQVTGHIYAADYAPPSPSNLTTAVGDMELAFTDAAGRAPDVTELGAGNVGGMDLAPGVYKWGTGLLIPTDLTLTGTATDVWIFQIAEDLTVSSAVKVVLAGGARAKNVFWQVAGTVDLGTTAHFEGVILTQTAIALHTGASINGRLLAQTAVTLDGATVVQPAQ